MRASLAPETTVRAPKVGPPFFATVARIVWVLSLTFAGLIGGIAYEARKQCPEPCSINGLTPTQALRGSQKQLPTR